MTNRPASYLQHSWHLRVFLTFFVFISGYGHNNHHIGHGFAGTGYHNGHGRAYGHDLVGPFYHHDGPYGPFGFYANFYHH